MKIKITRTGRQYKKVFNGVDFLKDHEKYYGTFESTSIKTLILITIGTILGVSESKRLRYTLTE